MSATLNISTEYISQNMIDWYSNATPGEISLALEVGARMVISGRNYLQSMGDLTLRSLNAESNAGAIKPGHSSYELGKIGEKHVYDALRSAFHDVSNVAESAASGDLMLHLKNKKITIEVKNYSNVIPSPSVEKFRRDLATTNAAGGVFVSLYTNITGMNTDFNIKYECVDNATIPVVYLVSDDSRLIINSVHIVSELISAVSQLRHKLYTQDRILDNVYSAADSLDLLSKSRNDLSVNIGSIQSMLRKNQDGIMRAEFEIRKQIDSIKDELYQESKCIGSSDSVYSRICRDHTISDNLLEPLRHVCDKIQSVGNRLSITPTAWKFNARKYLCVNTGASISVASGKIFISMPRVNVPTEKLIHILDNFAKKSTVSDLVSIQLDSETLPVIMDLLN